MVRHIALFRWKDDVTPEQLEEMMATIAEVGATPGLFHSFQFGTDLGLNYPGFGSRVDFGVVYDIDDDKYRAWDSLPAHEALRTTFGPMIAMVEELDLVHTCCSAEAAN